MALWVRDWAVEEVSGLIQHSDAGAIASIGTVGDSYNNALAESAIGLYKTECVRIEGPFHTVDEIELATLSWVHWFNENRLRYSIGYLAPIEKENSYRGESNARRTQLMKNDNARPPPGASHSASALGLLCSV